MPGRCDIPEAIPIITAIIGAAGLGESIYSQVNQPSAPKPNQAQIDATAKTNKNNQIAALENEFPNIQSQTGGSLSPDAWLKIAELLSGQAGQPGVGTAGQDLLTNFFGGGTSIPLTAGGGGETPGGGLTPRVQAGGG